MIKKLVKLYLPEEYQRVEYLQATEGAFIDTLFTPNQNSGFDFTFRFIKFDNNDNFGFGASYATGWGIHTHSTNAVGFTFGTDLYDDYFVPFEFTKYSIINQKCYKDGVLLNAARKPTTIQVGTDTTLKIFKSYGTKVQPNIEVQKVTLYDGKEVVRNFIPCYRKSDNVAGMYDLVSGVFFTNAGSGSFIVGDDVENEPIPMIKEITSIKKYIPNVGLVNMRKVMKAGDKQVFSNSNLFELRKFLKYNDTPFGNVIKLEDSLHWELGFIVNELRFDGDPIGSIHLGNYSHLYSEPVALNKGDQLILNCSVGSATKKGALYSNATANETSFIRFVQDNEIIQESGLYFRACYDIREPHELLLVKKYGSGILGICDIYHYDAFIYSDVILKGGYTYKISFDAKCNVNPNRTFWLHYADDIYQTDTSQQWEWHISGTGDWEHVEFNYTANRDMGIRLYAPFSTTETIQYYKDIIITQIN